MDWTRLIYRPLVTQAARRALVGRVRSRQTPQEARLNRAEIDEWLRTAWSHYQKSVGSLPPQPTIGSTMNVRLACFTMSFFDVLLAKGIERSYAIELIADAGWRVYRQWARVALAIARLTPWSGTALGFARVDRRLGSISLRFPFNAPGYLIETIATDGDVFDVVRCPIATYFRERQAADLCVASWCNLDYALAELTNQTLVRTKTLVKGDDRCDFRLRKMNVR
jgi:hypothetical protein